jgi:hypothetical protein
MGVGAKRVHVWSGWCGSSKPCIEVSLQFKRCRLVLTGGTMSGLQRLEPA